MSEINARIDRVQGWITIQCAHAEWQCGDRLALAVGRGWNDPATVSIDAITFYEANERGMGAPRGQWKRAEPSLAPDGVEARGLPDGAARIECVASSVQGRDYWVTVTISIRRRGGSDRFESKPRLLRRLRRRTDGRSADRRRASTHSIRHSP